MLACAVIGATAQETETQRVTIQAPETAKVGASFTVNWDTTLDPDDFVTIVPPDTVPGEYGDYIFTGEETSGELLAPAEPGFYEVRYVFAETNGIVGAVDIEIIDAEVSISGPETAAIGSQFAVSWTGAISPDDFVTIVLPDAPEGEYGDYKRVGNASENVLTAPAEPGLYQLRYLLNVGDRTMATAPIEITGAEISVSGPDEVMSGESFEITWEGAVNPNDYVTIVPVGTAEGDFGDYKRVRDAQSELLTAPPSPGLYELRYVLDAEDRTMATAPIEVVEPSVTVFAPDEILAGAQFEVNWIGAVNAADYVTIVPIGSEDGEFGDFKRVRDAESETLTAPGEPGLYEVRYVLDEGDRTMSRAEIEVLQTEVSITGPETVRVGENVAIEWSITINPNDYVVIAPEGSAADDIGDTYQRAGDGKSVSMTAPETPGTYEIRYVLESGRVMLASDALEIVAADASIDVGAGLSVPETGAPGTAVTISWSADVEGARVALARIDQADFTWIEAQDATEEMAAEFTLPQETGEYEIRFLDVANQEVLGRAVIAVR